jgi:hypothetical protein
MEQGGPGGRSSLPLGIPSSVSRCFFRLLIFSSHAYITNLQHSLWWKIRNLNLATSRFSSVVDNLESMMVIEIKIRWKLIVFIKKFLLVATEIKIRWDDFESIIIKFCIIHTHPPWTIFHFY